jgi:nucleoside-diphosphate-sugar epimerase
MDQDVSTILVTGAFGNVGQNTLAALRARGARVRAFDLPTRANRRAAQRCAGQIEVVWGDLRHPEDVARAVRGVQTVIHLAFVVPKLSATGVNCEERPDWARAINVGGSRNLIDALSALAHPPRLIFASSLHVYGQTQHLPPPRTTAEIPQPVEHYAHHKMEVEELVRAAPLDWSILRLAAALPLRLIMDPGMFDVPLDNRIEFIHTRDAGQAFAAAALCPALSGKTLLIGGGPRCQLIYRDMLGEVLDAMGIHPLPDEAFSRVPFATDWLDTAESQALLGYQQRTICDYANDLRRLLGLLRGGVIAAQPLVRRWLLAQSPYWRQAATLRQPG